MPKWIFDGVYNVDAGGVNTYLICAEKNALIGAADNEFCDEYIRNIKEIISIRKIDYLILPHTEPSCIETVKQILVQNPNTEIVASVAGIRNLKEMLNTDFRYITAKNGMTLSLGEASPELRGATLRFISAPCLPWHDSMLAYLEEEKTLFSGCIFSAPAEEGTGIEAVTAAAKAYYDEHFLPFKPYALEAAKKAKELNPKLILPSYGAALKPDIIDKYIEWSTVEKRGTKTAAIFYATVYGSTAKMAERVKKTLTDGGIASKLYDISDGFSETEINALNGADIFCFGVPTINQNAPKEIWRLLSEIDAVKMHRTPCLVFGSCGWSGEGTELLHRYLANMRLKPYDKPFLVYFTPTEDDFTRLSEYVKGFLKNL